MGVRKKLIIVVAGGEIAVSIAVLAAPLIFPLCSHGTATCGMSFKALIGVSAVVIFAAVLSIISKGMEAPRMLSGITALGGILMVLYPSFLIGVCDNHMMACTYGDLPFWNLCGGAVILLVNNSVLYGQERGGEFLKKLGLFHLAIRNIRRKLFRTVSIILSVAAVSGALFSATLVIYSVRKSISVGTERLGADVLVVPAQAESKAKGRPHIRRAVGLLYAKESAGRGKAGGRSGQGHSAGVHKVVAACVLRRIQRPADRLRPGHGLLRYLLALELLRGQVHRRRHNRGTRGADACPAGPFSFTARSSMSWATLAQTGMKYFDNSAFITLNAAYDMAKESSKKALKKVDVTPDMISTVLVKVKDGYDAAEGGGKDKLCG